MAFGRAEEEAEEEGGGRRVTAGAAMTRAAASSSSRRLCSLIPRTDSLLCAWLIQREDRFAGVCQHFAALVVGCVGYVIAVLEFVLSTCSTRLSSAH